MREIQSVSARTVAIPLDVPTSFATREVTHRHYTLVRVTDDVGNSGIGFCYAGNLGGSVVTEAVRSVFRDTVVGSPAESVREIWQRMYDLSLLHGRSGSVMRALSALDVAIWDCNARAVGLPLWAYLGSARSSRVPAYASGGYYRPGETPDDLADEMASYVEMGFSAVKMKVG